MCMRRHLGATACRISGRYVMHSTNAVGRHSMHTGTLSIDRICPSFLHRLACPSLASGLVASWSFGAVRLVCALILPVVLLVQPGSP